MNALLQLDQLIIKISTSLWISKLSLVGIVKVGCDFMVLFDLLPSVNDFISFSRYSLVLFYLFLADVFHFCFILFIILFFQFLDLLFLFGFNLTCLAFQDKCDFNQLLTQFFASFIDNIISQTPNPLNLNLSCIDLFQ